ncbi:MAG: molybdopterin-binding/glycosyltransferase family 2 protein [Rhizobiaceae bacterium]|nr:molybdopterin-binding/glycosyltransferase family 2 protein [Rhizobiaceae bacterium]MCV0408870.1 molybdopterin-binding/glycosyltransferase family 2 protein [Rhizobiaceae bacterium]
MRFGRIGLDEAEGAVLAHSLVAGALRLKKSRRLSADDISALRKAGIETVVAARLDEGDLDEDEAATRLASAFDVDAIEAKPAATGRVNLHATRAGLFSVDKAMVDAVNRVDPAITLATLADLVPVEAGRMVATVKIIPYAVAGDVVGRAIDLAARGRIFAVHGWRPARVGLIQTRLTATKASVLDKTSRTTEARLARSGSSIAVEERTDHETAAVADAIGRVRGEVDLIVIFGASAMSDVDDVVPAAIRSAGGTVERAGMPVDPGNLIALGSVAGRPVIGAPGCARSPKENGFDWVLDRVLTGMKVTADDIAGMGVGGLLMEIETRPQPREPGPGANTVHAVVLAAGRSSRMGGPNKLLARFGSVPLVRRTVERVVASRVTGVTVVTGHQADEVGKALSGARAKTVFNPRFAEGLAGSLKAGLSTVPETAGGLLVVLADMPRVETGHLDRMIAAFEKMGGRAAVRATHAGKRGNPVILPRSLFSKLHSLEGDAGARHLLEGGEVEIVDVEIGEGASIDVDTPEALARAGGEMPG